VRERQALERYLDSIEKTDEEQQTAIDPSAVRAALEKLQQHPEPEARFMPVAGTKAPAYNVQTAVDAEHGLIVAHAVTLEAGDNVQLQPMAEAAKKALGAESLQVVADAGYANGEQAARCEAAGILPHVPVKRAVNNQGGGTLFGREQFRYQPQTDTYLCPANKIIRRKQLHRHDKAVIYRADAADCSCCSMKARCTQTSARILTRLLDEDALNRMHQRATPQAMRLRRSTVELPFAVLKYRIFGHPRLLLRGKGGAQTEISLATLAYNLKRMVNLLGASKLALQLSPA
jgi:transposase